MVSTAYKMALACLIQLYTMAATISNIGRTLKATKSIIVIVLEMFFLCLMMKSTFQKYIFDLVLLFT